MVKKQKSKGTKPSSVSFSEKKELMELDLKQYEKRHEMKMRELEYMRETDRLHHERELERGRIKSAEIRKSQMRKDAFRGPRQY